MKIKTLYGKIVFMSAGRRKVLNKKRRCGRYCRTVPRMTELFVLVVLIVVTFALEARPAQKEGVPCPLGYSANALKANRK
jgi:hypothetical protein